MSEYEDLEKEMQQVAEDLEQQKADYEQEYGEVPEDLEEVQDEDQEELSPEQQQEEKARSDGWMPYDEWVEAGKDPTDWVDAKTFNVKGEFIGVISKQNRQLREMRETMEKFKEFHRKVEEKAEQNALERLKQEKREAMENMDYDRVMEIDDEMMEHKTKPKEPEEEPQNDEFAQYYQDWVPENKWYEDNVEMRGLADAAALDYYKKNPDATPEQVFAVAEKKVKERFPEEFGVKQRPRRNVASQPSTGAGSGKRSKNPVSRMNTEQRTMGQRFVDQGMIDSLEDYAKELEKIGEL